MADRALWAGEGRSLPALSAEDRVAAEQALAIYAEAPKGSSPATVAMAFGRAASVMASRPGNADEGKMRLAVYQESLSDIDGDVLKAAFIEAEKTLTFFPTIAEIRTIASRLPAPPRVFTAWRLRQLLAARTEAEPLAEVAPGEVTALLDSLKPEADAPTPRVPTMAFSKSMPTVEDYVALGLDEDAAIEAWDEHRRIMAMPRANALPNSLAA